MEEKRDIGVMLWDCWDDADDSPSGSVAVCVCATPL
jgi:hypothetical protein